MAVTQKGQNHNGSHGPVGLMTADLGQPSFHMTVEGLMKGANATVEWPVGNRGETDGFLELALNAAGATPGNSGPVRILVGAGTQDPDEEGFLIRPAQILRATITNLPDGTVQVFATVQDDTEGPNAGRIVGSHTFSLDIGSAAPAAPDLFVIGEPTIF